jgi:hypothetical protein
MCKFLVEESLQNIFLKYLKQEVAAAIFELINLVKID